VTSADANRARIGGRFEDGEDGTPLYSPAWVARRLGVTPATLRTWHHRYDLGPTGRTTGGHRRYSRGDLERLDRMRHLTAGGIGVAEAARLSHQAPMTPPHRRVPEHEDHPAHIAAPAAQLEPLIAAADDLDQAATGPHRPFPTVRCS
jgi:DNA-binding transcriptional MerR regulator